VTPAIKISQY